MHVSKWPRSRIVLESKHRLQGLPWEPRAAVQDTTWNYHPFVLMNKREPKSSVKAWSVQQTGVKPLLCKLLFRLCKSDFVLGKGGPRARNAAPCLVHRTRSVHVTQVFIGSTSLWSHYEPDTEIPGLGPAALPCTAGFASTVSGWAMATNQLPWGACAPVPGDQGRAPAARAPSGLSPPPRPVCAFSPC